MRRTFDNPVIGLAGRGTRGWRLLLAIAALLAALVVVSGLLQQYWIQDDVYVGRRPHLLFRWYLVLLTAQAALLPLWSGVRAAFLWQWLRDAGQLAECRATRLSPAAIAGGAAAASLKPQAIWLALSLLIGVGVVLGHDGTLTVGQVVAAHAVLAAACAAFAALGQWLAHGQRLAITASALAVGAAFAAVAGVAVLTPLYPLLAEPPRWIYAALLPNPVVAVGTALQWDVLRTPWVYEHLQVVDYAGGARINPWPWETTALYALLAALLLALQVRALRRGGAEEK